MFAALYVHILAVLGPLLSKESKLVYQWLDPLFKWTARNESIRPLKSHPMHRTAEEKILYIVVYRLELVTIMELVRSVDPDAGLTVMRMDHWA